MKIATIEIYQYALPFKQPYIFRKHVLTHRRGILLRIITENGIRGFGDIAPFPGLNQETFSDAVGETIRVARSLTGCEVPQLPGRLTDRFERWLFAHYLSPSVNFGLQAACLDIHARSSGTTLSKYLNPEASNSLPVTTLITGNTEDALEKARALSSRKIQAVKIKVGNLSIKEDAERVRAVCRILRPTVRVRLDANRAWDYDEAVTFAHNVSDCPIEYIEEPLKDPTRLVSFSAQTGIPCAIDETIAEQGWEHLERWRGARVAVLKPTVLGGFEVTMWLARRAYNVGMIPVISSSIESGVGIAALAHFAAAIQPPEIPAGLDTTHLFLNDILNSPLVRDDNTIPLEELTLREDNINWSIVNNVQDNSDVF